MRIKIFSAVAILREAKWPHIHCLSLQGEFWNGVTHERPFAVKRTLERSKKYIELRRVTLSKLLRSLVVEMGFI